MDAYEYAVIRVVPRVERGEMINVGVLLYCQHHAYLRSRVELDADRLRMLDPGVDLAAVERALGAFHLAITDEEGPLAKESLGNRFRWLAAPRSTIVQTSPAHIGLTDDPEAEVDRLFDRLVRPPTG